MGPSSTALDEVADIHDVIAGRTLMHAFDSTVERRGEGRAFRWRRAGEWHELSWVGLAERVDAVANGLAGLGLARGNRVALFTGCRPEHLIADLGAVSVGAVGVSLYDTFSDEQLERVLASVEPRVVVVDGAERHARLQRARESVGCDMTVVMIDDPKPGTTSWSELVQSGRSALLAAPGRSRKLARPEPDDALAIAYTSGTTGDLKAVVHTHRGVLWHAESFRRRVGVDETDSTVAYLPYAHATSRFVAYYMPLISGAEIHFCAELDQLRDHLLDCRPTLMVGILQVWENLYRAILDAADGFGFGQAVRDAVDSRRRVLRADRAERAEMSCAPGFTTADEAEEAAAVCAAVLEQVGLNRCRFGASGAGHLALEVVEFFNALGLPLAEGWGQSELMSAATIASPTDVEIGTVGPALPGVEVRTAGDGELLVRAGSTMCGYYAEPQRTAATIDEDGWVSTGDVGVVEASGHVRVLGRRGEFVTRADGAVVSFGRVESLLKTHPAVGNACVVATRPAGLHVLLNPAEQAEHTPCLADDLKAHVAWANGLLSPAEQIDDFIVVGGPWIPGISSELTHTGKLRRAFIAETYEQEIGALGAVGSPSSP